MNRRFLLALWLLVSSSLSAREWTSTEGRKLQAEFVSATDSTVTLKLANGQTSTLPLARLSAADQTWVREQTSQAKPAFFAKPIEGRFAHLITGKWEFADLDMSDLAPRPEGRPPREPVSYAVYGAKDLDATKKYPLIVAWHDYTAGMNPPPRIEVNGEQVKSWIATLITPESYAKRPCIIVAPLCGGWFVSRYLELTKAMIKELPVDKQRIYTVGFRQGGCCVCGMIREGTDIFAAGIAVSGASPGGREGDSPSTPYRKVPIWIFQSADDDGEIYGKPTRDLAKALKSIKHCKYTEFPTGGFAIADKVFNNPATFDWLFAQGVKNE